MGAKIKELGFGLFMFGAGLFTVTLAGVGLWYLIQESPLVKISIF